MYSLEMPSVVSDFTDEIFLKMQNVEPDKIMEVSQPQLIVEIGIQTKVFSVLQHH